MNRMKITELALIIVSLLANVALVALGQYLYAIGATIWVAVVVVFILDNKPRKA